MTSQSLTRLQSSPVLLLLDNMLELLKRILNAVNVYMRHQQLLSINRSHVLKVRAFFGTLFQIVRLVSYWFQIRYIFCRAGRITVSLQPILNIDIMKR